MIQKVKNKLTKTIKEYVIPPEEDNYQVEL